MVEPRFFSAGDLHAGLRAEFERDITAVDVASFAALSGDHNPLHMDETYALETNYGARIVHGALQVALASAMAGMYLPGLDVVVASFQCRFPAPLRYPCRVRVQGEITAWVPPSLSGTLRVRVMELAGSLVTAEIHVGFSLHEKRARRPAGFEPAPLESETARHETESDKPVVLVTGAGGGLGQHLVSTLAARYQVVAMARSAPTINPSPQSAPQSAQWIEADLTSGDWEASADRELRGRKIYGLVHAAWPLAPQGSLLDVEPEAVAAQVDFGSAVTIRIARFLRSRVGDTGRLVVLGTTAATLKPVLNLSAYSLGKAALEHTIRLLAPDLARKKITVNLVAPSFVAVGMNSAKTSRILLSETAKVPLGRLCAPDDIAGAVEFFLSPAASFVTGQLLPLTGGQW